LTLEMWSSTQKVAWDKYSRSASVLGPACIQWHRFCPR